MTRDPAVDDKIKQVEAVMRKALRPLIGMPVDETFKCAAMDALKNKVADMKADERLVVENVEDLPNGKMLVTVRLSADLVEELSRDVYCPHPISDLDDGDVCRSCNQPDVPHPKETLMDPNAAWNGMLESLLDGRTEPAREYAEALMSWIEKDGFLPRVTQQEMNRDDVFNLAKAVSMLGMTPR